MASEIITPLDMEREWGLSGGHIFHGETTLDQSWWARPSLGWARYRTPLPGLYLASAGTHPGGGLTGANGLLAARTVLDEW
jgi:phytoene dehydrogenase-like protein